MTTTMDSMIFHANLEEYLSSANDDVNDKNKNRSAADSSATFGLSNNDAGGTSFLTAATKLLEKQREMMEVDEALLSQKEGYDMAMETFRKRQEEIQQKEEILKESLLKFDRYLRDNDSKRFRAIEKARKERAEQIQLTRQIPRFKQEILHLYMRRAELERQMKFFRKYELFVENAVQLDPVIFGETFDVVQRYNTLALKYRELFENEQQAFEKIDSMASQVRQLDENMKTEILKHNYRLGKLQLDFDESDLKYQKLEAAWSRIKNTAAEKTLELGRIRMSVHNLFMSLCKHQRVMPLPPASGTGAAVEKPTAAAENMFQQLRFIGEFMEDTNSMLALAATITPETMEIIAEQAEKERKLRERTLNNAARQRHQMSLARSTTNMSASRPGTSLGTASVRLTNVGGQQETKKTQQPEESAFIKLNNTSDPAHDARLPTRGRPKQQQQQQQQEVVSGLKHNMRHRRTLLKV